MKFLVLLMAPGFHFYMDESPSENDIQWILSLFVFTPSSSISHPYVISGDKYSYINFTVYKYNLEKGKRKFLLSD